MISTNNPTTAAALFARISSQLYVGNLLAASDVALLRAHGVRGVLSTVHGSLCDYPAVADAARELNVKHSLLALEDSPSGSLAPHLDAIRRFVKENSPVLVHCVAGVSRSVAVTMAFLLLEGESLVDVLRHVRRAHPTASPAPWFLAELEVIDAGGRASVTAGCQQAADAPLWLRSRAVGEERVLEPSCDCAFVRCRKCGANVVPCCAPFASHSRENLLLARWLVQGLPVGERIRCVKCGAKMGSSVKATWINGVVAGVGDVVIYALSASKIDWPLGKPWPSCESKFELHWR